MTVCRSPQRLLFGRDRIRRTPDLAWQAPPLRDRRSQLAGSHGTRYAPAGRTRRAAGTRRRRSTRSPSFLSNTPITGQNRSTVTQAALRPERARYHHEIRARSGLMSPECQRYLSWVRAFDDERRQPTRPHPAVHQTAVKPARAVTNSDDGRPTHQAHCPFSGLLGLPPLRPAWCCLPTPGHCPMSRNYDALPSRRQPS